MHHLAANNQKHVTNSGDINLLPQCSIVGDSCDLSKSTSTQQLFICQNYSNANLNGNLLFPLTVKHENTAKYKEKISWHDLVKYFKSQRIVKNIEMFKTSNGRQQYEQHTQEFPLEIKLKQTEQFPFQNISQDVKKIFPTSIKLKETESENVTKLKFPLKANTKKAAFAYTTQRQDENIFNNKISKIHQLVPKSKQHLKLMPKKFPLQGNINAFHGSKGLALKFPQKLFQNAECFPFKNKSVNHKILEIKTKIPKSNSTNCLKEFDHKSTTKFPCKISQRSRLAANSNLSKFPIHDEEMKVTNSNNSKICLTLSVTHNNQTFESCNNEHVSQVQYAQVHVGENPQALTVVENKQPPPQLPTVKTIHDDDVDDYILAAINSINNTRSNDVGYYAGKIERIQDAIVALFDRIKNSLTTNHNSETKSTNAVGHEQHYDDGDARFALTPPMSVTSVQNTKRTHKDECDLGDLYVNPTDQIVECSDVRDTLAETVDYGVRKEQTISTGSFLVKSKESTSPNSPTPQPLCVSTYTSLVDYINANKLLPNYNVLIVSSETNVDVKNKLECDPNKLNEINELTVRKTHENISDSVLVSEMTVTRLANNEQEITNEENNLQSSEALKHKSDILSNDFQIDEMKFEMNRVKGALPSSASERSLGKQENSQYGRHIAANSARLSTDTSLNHNRLPSSQSSTRNYNDNSYTPRSSLTNDSKILADAANKRSVLNTTLPQDTVPKRSSLSTPAKNEVTPNRSTLNSLKNLNDTSSDAINQRRPSLSALRSAQPTSQLSVDLPNYSSTGFNSLKNSNNPSSDVVNYRRPSLGALRSTQSTSLLSVDLPNYTPLIPAKSLNQTTPVSRAFSIDSSLQDVLPEKTRLRRQRRLRSQDEPEDPIERLNRLKARISASLSEVKGVLKQYSTETENENENQNAANANIEVKKFETPKEEEKKPEGPVPFRFVKKVRRRSIFLEEDENEQTDQEKNKEMPKEKTDSNIEKQIDSQDVPDNKFTIETTLLTQSSEITKEHISEIQENQIEQAVTNEGKPNKNLYTLKEEIHNSWDETKQNERKPAEEHVKIKAEKENNSKTVVDQVSAAKEESQGVKPKLRSSSKQETHETTTKNKKKVINKLKDTTRRASLAAVEGSKIEPPIKLAIPATIHRRPSDSEAIVKKKLITAKINTSGAVEEVTPKPKIVKVKKSSLKNNNNSQLATTQSKLIEKDAKMTAANNKSDDHVKSIDEDNKSIHIDENKDILMPKQPERPQQQQQINTKITSQTNLLLPTQLVIDEAASLNVKTIENSVLSPKQLQQQKQNREQKKENQATIKSTTTNLKSNDLQAGGAMLEDLTTVLSSPTASEANGQIKRENVPQDNLLDLLQNETTIIRASTANKQNELKSQVKQVENNNLEVKSLINDNLENLQSSDREQQQVVKTTDDIENDNKKNNKKKDVKNDASLKETCVNKTPTSPHDSGEQQLVEGKEQSKTNVADTKTLSSPHISISSTSDITQKTSESSTKLVVDKKADASAEQQNTMPELQLTPAPVQTAEIIRHPEHHKKKIILKKVLRQSSVDKSKKDELEITKPVQQEAEQVTDETSCESIKDELTEECSESTEISETSTSVGSEEVASTETPKRERKVKKKVIIKRQKRRLSIGDNFFHPGAVEESQNSEVETVEKPIAYFTDDEADQTEGENEETAKAQEQQEDKKPLKSCIMQKEYHIGDEVLYAERFKKTQIKWRRGRIKERITSISYLLDIDGKDVSSHINYLKKFTGRKVSFGGKEYLEIDYEQLAEEEEKAEKLQRRTYSIWNMV